jgi:hypothetical protein
VLFGHANQLLKRFKRSGEHQLLTPNVPVRPEITLMSEHLRNDGQVWVPKKPSGGAKSGTRAFFTAVLG